MRRKRDVQIDVPHHVAHRGNHRQTLFANDDDRRYYLSLVHRYSRDSGARIAGYCLMSNHVHWIVVPEGIKSLQRCFGRAHKSYSEYLNRRRSTHGGNWEGRYYSVPMDPVHAVNALRYVERNPVAAGLVKEAHAWPWSSAAGHCGIGKPSAVLNLDLRPLGVLDAEWRRQLRAELSERELETVPWAYLSETSGTCHSGAFAQFERELNGSARQYTPA